ncbi:protoheme IX biogenesis protein HemY, partial [Yersinia pestis]|nr:protoheme IX biogenesis protein HemY [Yersinia pestis]
HPEVLRLAEQAYLRSAAYRSLLDILPAMSKKQIHTPEEVAALEQQAYLGIMTQCMADEGREGLKRGGKDQSRTVRNEIPL